MTVQLAVGIALAVIVLGLALAIRIVRQYERGVLLRFGRVLGERQPGFRMIIPFVDVMHRVSLRVVTMPIQSQGIITRDNVSVDVSAVAYFRVIDATKSVVAIESVRAAIDQIAQTTADRMIGPVPGGGTETTSPTSSATTSHRSATAYSTPVAARASARGTPRRPSSWIRTAAPEAPPPGRRWLAPHPVRSTASTVAYGGLVGTGRRARVSPL